GHAYYSYPGERRLVNYFTTVPLRASERGGVLRAALLHPETDFLKIAGKLSWAIDQAWPVGGVFYAWHLLETGRPAPT
ncbi:MAG: hypothetical protein ACJ8DO_00340, partial [Microvirga sp.]